MKIIGIICEYSPFHNRHIYHIQKIKEKYPDSLLILCLNGYFLERGQVSLLSKENKTKIALQYQVDLVIELPLLYGTQSADKFAYASTYLLDAIGAQTIIFGSESKDIARLESIALKQLDPKFTFLERKNKSYPQNLATSLAEIDVIPPNDLLGISYIKAILEHRFALSYECIKRTSDFHDLKSTNSIISASNIREKLKNNEDVSFYLPACAYQEIKPIDEDKLFELLKFRILTDAHLEEYLDVTEGLENKLRKEILMATSYSDLIWRCKSSRYTYNRLARMLCHILLGIRKSDSNIPISYIHILGFSKRGQEYLKKHRKEIKLPTHIDRTSKLYSFELVSSQLYDMLTHGNAYTFEKRNHPITIGSNESSQK